MAMDPVCHMDVDEETAQWMSVFREKTYYFCAPGCKRDFDADPEKYLHKTDGDASRHHHDHKNTLHDDGHHH